MVSYNFVFYILSIFLWSATLTVADSDETSDIVSYASRDVSHNIYDCVNPTDNKTLLYSTVVNEDANFFSYVTKTITFPSSSVNSYEITCIVVTDNDGDGTGGYPSIISGGVASYSVEIQLESQWNQGLHFSVKIYTDS